MRILHVITSLDTGGAEIMLFKLLGNINKQQFDSKVICLLPIGPVGRQIRDLGINVETLGFKRGTISPLGLFKLVKIIKGWKPDILQTWLYHADLLGYLAAKLTGIKKLVWNIRCTNIELYKNNKIISITLKACAFFSKFPTAIIANSNIARDYHTKTLGYHSKNFDIIFNGFDLSEFKQNSLAGEKIRKELDIAGDTICVGIVGRYDPMKGHESFIKAAGLVNEKFPGVVYILAGKDMCRKNTGLMTTIKKKNLQNNVRLLGERQDIPDIMNALDIYCSASAFGEGFPNVVGEAMACGVPCVVTDVGHSGSIVDDTGFVVHPGNHESLAQGILKLVLLSRKERHELGLKARRRMELNYSLPKIVKQYENLYSTISML